MFMTTIIRMNTPTRILQYRTLTRIGMRRWRIVTRTTLTFIIDTRTE